MFIQDLKSNQREIDSEINNCFSGWLMTVWLLLAAGMSALGDTAPELDAPAKQEAIPWNQLGAKATAQYSGEGLAVFTSQEGVVRLRCAFQRLEGEVTSEGLWLISTAPDQTQDRFSVRADSVGREGGATNLLRTMGEVSQEQNLARYSRAGLAEEYQASVDGVRQDFVVLEQPAGAKGPLRVELAVRGALAEAAGESVGLLLRESGRKLAYSRLRVEDATGKELGARLEVVSQHRLAVVVADEGATYPVRIDPTFSDADWVSMGGPLGANGTVNAVVIDGAGNLYIGGDFTVVGDVVANRIAKWNGSTWSSLGSGMNSNVLALAVSGSNLYAGGDFTTAGGVRVNYIAKWNGSTWSSLGSGMNDAVNALAVSGSGLYAGGIFTTAGGKVSAYVAKALLNQPLGLSFNAGTATVRFVGIPNTTYHFEACEDLVAQNWQEIGETTADANGLFWFSDTDAGSHPTRYYRAWTP